MTLCSALPTVINTRCAKLSILALEHIQFTIIVIVIAVADLPLKILVIFDPGNSGTFIHGSLKLRSKVLLMTEIHSSSSEKEVNGFRAADLETITALGALS